MQVAEMQISYIFHIQTLPTEERKKAYLGTAFLFIGKQAFRQSWQVHDGCIPAQYRWYRTKATVVFRVSLYDPP